MRFCVEIFGPESKHADPNGSGPFRDLPGGPIADFVTHVAYLVRAFVGNHHEVHTTWRRRGRTNGVAADEMRALVEAERGSATLVFSAHSRPEVFALRIDGTRMRARASLFEPLLAVERLHSGPRPLIPVRNGLALARAHARCAVTGLWRKLQGRPVTYAGLRSLVEQLYASLEAGIDPPLSLADVKETNRLVRALLEGAPRE
jgi:predicted dehydrogenase